MILWARVRREMNGRASAGLIFLLVVGPASICDWIVSWSFYHKDYCYLLHLLLWWGFLHCMIYLINVVVHYYHFCCLKTYGYLNLIHLICHITSEHCSAINKLYEIKICFIEWLIVIFCALYLWKIQIYKPRVHTRLWSLK